MRGSFTRGGVKSKHPVAAGGGGGGGALNHGDAFDITGSGFGTNTDPLVYDTFQSGTLNALIKNHAGVFGTWEDNHPGEDAAFYSNAVTRGAHTRTAYLNFREGGPMVNGQAGLGITHLMTGGETVYGRMWFRVDRIDNFSRNWKPWRYYTNDDNAYIDEVWLAAVQSFTTLGIVPVDLNCGLQDAHDQEVAWPASTSWHLYEFLLTMGSTTANDQILRRYDNGSTQTVSGAGNLRCSTGPKYELFRFGHFWETDGTIGPPFDGDIPDNSGCDIYCSDPYLGGPKRVVIGNNASYNSCTVVEVQPCAGSDWADTTIHIPHFNQGALTSGTKWWYVFTGVSFTPAASGTVTVA